MTTIVVDGYGYRLTLVQRFIEMYSVAANQAINLGFRPARLQCEAVGELPCSVKFANVLEKGGLPAAIKDLAMRCPKGAGHVPAALLKSLWMAFSGGGYKPNKIRREHGAPSSPYNISYC